MTEYDLRQWRDCTTTAATLNIAAAKFKTWQTRIRFTEEAEELLLEMKTDVYRLWDSGLKGSLVNCIYLYNKVWNRVRIMFQVLARTDILERDGLLTAFSAATDILKNPMIEDIEKESTE